MSEKIIRSKERLAQASAPATLMLLGEYAVLHGYPSVVIAFNRRITVTITPKISQGISISSTLGNFDGTQAQLAKLPQWNYLSAAMAQFPKNLDRAHIHIDSEFSHLLGLGSSSAITIATLAALQLWWYQKTIEAQNLFEMGLNCLKHLNKKGSGADMAGACFGGMISFIDRKIQPLQYNGDFLVAYTGKKASTDQAISRIRYHAEYFKRIGQLSEQGIQAIIHHDRLLLGQCMREQHKILCQLGVNITQSDAIIQHCYKMELTDAIKISGAGFGDCLIALRKENISQPSPLPPTLHPARFLDIQPDAKGVIYVCT